MRTSLFVLLAAGLLAVGPANQAGGQDEDDPAKAAELISDAIKARGGEAYLKIRTIMTQGQYTGFAKGVSGIPQPFVDYIVYPDRERTEFSKGNTKVIQTNVASTGWVYEAEQKMIRDQTEDQIKVWLQGIRYDLDNLLRRGSKEPGVKLVYLGRREAWLNTFTRAVRLDFTDGASTTMHFDPKSKLPVMTEYKMVHDVGTSEEQIRYYQWIEVDGVQFPKIQDSYRAKIQTSRVYYDQIKFNADIPEKLFAKPASIKEVK
ncbi:MAG TPA: hypothetical protein VFV34_28865 [Blastocatellia bacterium]|nr:hypothetical protein [Blastocatellia bacterium]